jgi:predicted permease
VLISALVLGLGIATMTVVFSVAYSLFLRPLPGVASPGKVVEIGAVAADGTRFNTFSYPAYQRLQGVTGVFDGLAAHGISAMGLTLDGYAKQVWGVVVTPNYFQVLGVGAQVGRLFAPKEPDPHVVVLSHKLWSREFGADRTVVGRRIELNGQAFTVVGIAPKAFMGTMRGFGPELWVPIAAHSSWSVSGHSPEASTTSWLQIAGRLRSNVSTAVGAAKLTHGIEENGAEDRMRGVRHLVLQTAGVLSGGARAGVLGFVTILMIAAGGLLLTATSNVSGMLLARSSARGREIAIRLAVGAPRGKLFKQFVAEGLLLGAAGALAGVLMAAGILHWLNGIRPPVDVPLALELGLHSPVLALACAIAGVAALAFVVIPTQEAWRTDVMTVLRNGAHTAARGDTRLRVHFVTVQAISTVLLLAIAGTFANAVRKGLTVDPGIEPGNVVVTSLNMEARASTPAAGHALQERLLDRIRAVPDVEDAALTTSVPLGQATSRAMISRSEGLEATGGVPGGTSRVSTGYFRALRIPILRGRDFQPTDRDGSPRVAVVNQVLAKQLWAFEDPIGRSLRLGGQAYEVIGVARNGKYGSISEAPQAFVYLSLAQEYAADVALLAKLRHSPTAALTTLPRLVREVDPGVPVANVMTMDAHIALNVLPQRIAASLTAALGIVGLLLAATGLYGTISYMVGTRTREFGVRMALGETRRSVRSSVMKGSMWIVVKGVIIGSLLAAGAMFLVQRLAFGVGIEEALVVGISAGAVLITAAGASYFPALRATRVDPAVALRAE